MIVNHCGELFHYRGREEFKDDDLWSFKFTPTDEIWPLHQQLPPPIYQQPRFRFKDRYKDQCRDWSPGHGKVPRGVVRDQTPTRVSTHLARLETEDIPHPSTDFFNRYIRPDLTTSRLRLGPAALRTAVNCASLSPTRSAIGHAWRNCIKQKCLNMTFDTSQPCEAQESSSSSDMNPEAIVFTPTTSHAAEFSEEPPEEHDSVNDSLKNPLSEALRLALVEERGRHAMTKAALDNEVFRRVEAENVVEKLTEENQILQTNGDSLETLVKRLWEIIETQQVTYKPEKPSPEIQEDVVDLPHAYQLSTEAQNPVSNLRHADHPIKSDSKGCILSHVLEDQRVRHQETHYFEHSKKEENEKTEQELNRHGNNVLVSTTTTQPETNVVSELFSLQNIVQKHFLGLLDLNENGNVLSQARSTDVKNNLAEASTKSANPAQTTIKETLQACQKAFEKPKAILDPAKEVMEQFNKEPIEKNIEATTPEATHDVVQGLEALTFRDAVAPGAPKTTQGVSSDERNEKMLSFESPAPSVDVLFSSIPHTSAPIYWKINAHKGVFDDNNQKNAAMRLQPKIDQEEKETFWQHPVRYVPNVSGKNIYRTVMIDFIPLGCTYRDVLEVIHTGALESIQLFPNIGKATNFMTARMVFNYELGARDLYMQGEYNGIQIKGQRVRVWMVPEPTYPKNKQLEDEVFEGGYTRLLLLDNAKDRTLATLPEKLAKQIKAGFVIEIGQAHDGVPQVEFTSVAEAVKALRQLMHDPIFEGVVFDFDEDYCESAFRKGVKVVSKDEA